jgi:hypothetical protein
MNRGIVWLALGDWSDIYSYKPTSAPEGLVKDAEAIKDAGPRSFAGALVTSCN